MRQFGYPGGVVSELTDSWEWRCETGPTSKRKTHIRGQIFICHSCHRYIVKTGSFRKRDTRERCTPCAKSETRGKGAKDTNHTSSRGHIFICHLPMRTRRETREMRPLSLLGSLIPLKRKSVDK
jgi:hypothetical protein